MSRKLNKRRDFLKGCAHMALLGATGSAVGGKMSMIGSALAAQGDYANLPDYKALVCVFHYGGADSFNMFVPGEQSLFNQYTASRGDLALDANQLDADDTGSVLFNRNLGALRDYYNAGNLAIVRNVGNLIEPISASQFVSNPELVPADLFAHNSQQLPPTFSMANSNFFLPGSRSTPIAINPLNGPRLLPFLDRNRRSANTDQNLSAMRVIARVFYPAQLVARKTSDHSIQPMVLKRNCVWWRV